MIHNRADVCLHINYQPLDFLSIDATELIVPGLTKANRIIRKI